MSQTVASPQTKTPIKVNKLGHLVYEVSDIERSTKFWTEILGFTVSDTNQWGMVFLRCNDDHHSIALVPSEKQARPPAESGLRFHHLAMEVDSMDVLFRARDFLRERGMTIDFEGRRGQGGILQSCDLGVAIFLQLGRRGGVVAVAINDHEAGSRS